MSEYFADSADFISVANAIRQKGVSGSLYFPYGFISAIESIQTGRDERDPAVVDKTVVSYENSYITQIRSYAFAYCGSLTSAIFPNVISVGESAFYNCFLLSSVDLGSAEVIGPYAFAYCSSLITLSLPQASIISTRAFYSAKNFLTLYLMSTAFVSIDNQAFSYTSLISYGTIYVPSSLLAQYRGRYSFYSRFFGI